MCYWPPFISRKYYLNVEFVYYGYLLRIKKVQKLPSKYIFIIYITLNIYFQIFQIYLLLISDSNTIWKGQLFMPTLIPPETRLNAVKLKTLSYIYIFLLTITLALISTIVSFLSYLPFFIYSFLLCYMNISKRAKS